MKFSDDENKEVVRAIAPLLKTDENSICAYVIVAINHDDAHTPITLASMPPEEMTTFLEAISLLIYGQLHAN